MNTSRKWNTPEELYEDWLKFCQECDENVDYRTEFSQKLADFVTKKVPSPMTYTIKGFVAWADMTEQNFYKTYGEDSKFESVIARVRLDCENDARKKFENGSINSRLAGLWMSNYGYTTKTESNVTGAVPVVISGGEELKD